MLSAAVVISDLRVMENYEGWDEKFKHCEKNLFSVVPGLNASVQWVLEGPYNFGPFYVVHDCMVLHRLAPVIFVLYLFFSFSPLFFLS